MITAECLVHGMLELWDWTENCDNEVVCLGSFFAF